MIFGFSDFAVACLTSKGQFDASFGVGGKATVDFNGFGETGWSADLQSNGQVILSGDVNTTSTIKKTGLARLNSNGALDTTFGQGGKSVSDFGNVNEYMRDALIQIAQSAPVRKLSWLEQRKQTQSITPLPRATCL